VHPKPIFDCTGQVSGALNMLIDMTAIKRSELALKESESKLRSLTISLEEKVEERTREVNQKIEDIKRNEERHYKMIEEVEDYAIILLDKEGTILNWNKGAEKIKGYKEAEIVGKKFNIFYLPEDQAIKRPETLLAQADKLGKVTHEGWRVRRDGTTFWGNVVITALHDEQNNVIGYSKVTRDLTERKVTEDKVKQYTSELEFQNKELQQFAFVAAHDMKEPIRKIQFYVSSVIDGVGSTLPDKERGYLTQSVQATTRMNGLIDDLLKYSKISASVDQFSKVDLNKVLNNIIQIHQDSIDQINAVIKSDPLPAIWGIPFQIWQLFDNLIGNALKYYHPERTPRITINCEKISYLDDVPGTKLASPFYKISFKDNGIGFEQEHAEKIFEVFQRLHTQDKYIGTGIGLAICKKIVQNHKGVIQASGDLLNGACFSVYLPLNNNYQLSGIYAGI
jgi:PAS domain S-box-containing protein